MIAPHTLSNNNARIIAASIWQTLLQEQVCISRMQQFRPSDFK